MTITAQQYFRDKPHPVAHTSNFLRLNVAVDLLLAEAAAEGDYGYWRDPDTRSQISGSKGGAGDGGYRLPDSTTGAAGSNHKSANAIDIYDPNRMLAAWCVAHPDRLSAYGLYMEDPRWTPVWCHLQRVAPTSGKAIYIPSTSAPLAVALPGQKPIPMRIKI